jgi:hypothetical protein
MQPTDKQLLQFSFGSQKVSFAVMLMGIKDGTLLCSSFHHFYGSRLDGSIVLSASSFLHFEASKFRSVLLSAPASQAASPS